MRVLFSVIIIMIIITMIPVALEWFPSSWEDEWQSQRIVSSSRIMWVCSPGFGKGWAGRWVLCCTKAFLVFLFLPVKGSVVF